MPNQLNFLLREIKALWMEEKQQMSYHNSSKVFYKGLCAFPRRKLEKRGLDESTQAMESRSVSTLQRISAE